MAEVGEDRLMWLGQGKGINAADRALARRWGGDTKSLHVSCSRLLRKTRASPESRSGAESSHAKEVMAGEIQAHVASKPWGRIAHLSSWGSTEVPGLTGASRF